MLAIIVAPETDCTKSDFVNGLVGGEGTMRTNAEADGDLLARVAKPDDDGVRLLTDAAQKLKLSARGYHRVLRVARTLADLEASDGVRRPHVAEALSYRRVNLRG